MTGAVISAIVAAAFIGLSRWGLRNVTELVPAHSSPERRAKDERSLRRGARSCFAVGVLFALFAVVLTVDSIVGS
jgi:hypothetical protein